MKGSLGALDLAVVGAYLAATFLLGVRSSRNQRRSPRNPYEARGVAGEHHGGGGKGTSDRVGQEERPVGQQKRLMLSMEATEH